MLMMVRCARICFGIARGASRSTFRLVQADSGADAGHDFVSYFVGTAGAADEKLVDVKFVGEKFFAAFAHGWKCFHSLSNSCFLKSP
jgi:hypothetical protein